MFYVYIIRSEKNSKYYVGYTSNIVNRLISHNKGNNRSTKIGRPWKLILSEEYKTRTEAWKRERQIKRYKGGSAFQKLIGGVA